MPSPFAHLALGAAVAHALGFRGRERALAGLWAAAPDLDSFLAIPWMLLAPHLPLSADWLFLGQHLFDHRGFSHTVLAAALAAGGVWLWTHDLRWTAAAGAAWLSHVLFDIVSPWPVHPWWPFSDATVNHPIVTTLDPVLNALALVATLALVAQIFARRERILRWADHWAGPSIAAALLAVPLSYGALVATSASADVPLGSVYPAGFPSAATIEPTEGGWLIEEWMTPFEHGPERFVPLISSRNVGAFEDAVAIAACTLENLGPYAPISTPAWWTRPREPYGHEVVAYDLSRNATETGAPRVVFEINGFEVLGIYVQAGHDAMQWLKLRVPDRVVEAAKCP